MWLVFALLSPLFWAIVHVLDSHCVERVFSKPWLGVITSSLASLVIFLILPFAAPFVVWQAPSGEIATLAVLAGSLIQLSQAFYFQALAYSEAGIVYDHHSGHLNQLLRSLSFPRQFLESLLICCFSNRVKSLVKN